MGHVVTLVDGILGHTLDQVRSHQRVQRLLIRFSNNLFCFINLVRLHFVIGLPLEGMLATWKLSWSMMFPEFSRSSSFFSVFPNEILTRGLFLVQVWLKHIMIRCLSSKLRLDMRHGWWFSWWSDHLWSDVIEHFLVFGGTEEAVSLLLSYLNGISLFLSSLKWLGLFEHPLVSGGIRRHSWNYLSLDFQPLSYPVIIKTLPHIFNWRLSCQNFTPISLHLNILRM